MKNSSKNFFALCCLLTFVTLHAEETDSAVNSAPLQEQEVLEASPTQGESEFKLVINPDQAQKVSEIVTTLGSHNLISLGFKRSHLSNLGKELDGLGAFNFLGYIFSEPALKAHMGAIKQSSFKWNGFVSGIIPGLKTESQLSTFPSKVQAFANYLEIPALELQQKADENEWDAFVGVLVKLCCTEPTSNS